MKKSTIVRSLVLSMLSLLLCVSMLIGTTFAWFTDEVESGKNIIKSGNLDIELEYFNGTQWVSVEDSSDIFDDDALWEPGYTEVAYFRIKNVGDLALQYSCLMNVINPGAGTNVYDQAFELADHIQYSIVEGVNGQSNPYASRTDAIDAATAAGQVPRALSNHTAERVTDDQMLSGDVEYFAIVVWMPTTVGNEANYMTGTPAPVVEFGVTVIATQTPYEEDAYDNSYDGSLSLDWYAIGTAFFNSTTDVAAEAIAINGAGYNVASAVIDKDSLAAGVDKATLRVAKTEYEGNFTVGAGLSSFTYDITVDGLKENNDVDVKVEVKLPANLDPSTVVVYHEDTLIPSNYTPEDGYVTFETKSFSPFTFVYDANSTYVPGTPNELPKASVSVYTPTEPIVWGSYGQWSPTEGLEAELDAIYQFSCTESFEEAKESPYANWHCDFYVVLDKELGANEIFLGGNYGTFGWVGFHNGDLTLDANTEIGLLESVTTNPWTYLDVVQNVGTFICGVGNVDGSLEGATFKVMLRLTNPDDPTDIHNIETITYQFTAN